MNSEMTERSSPSAGSSAELSASAALKLLRKQIFTSTLLRATALTALLAAISALFVDKPALLIIISLTAWLVLMASGLLRSGYRELDGARLAGHLDRCFPEFEESAALLTLPPQQPTTLQRLQQQRIAPRWNHLLIQRKRWLPVLRWQGPVLMVLCALLVLLTGRVLDGQVTGPHTGKPPAVSGSSSPSATARPELLAITITPPVYTGLPERQQQAFDLEVPEGSLLRWSLLWPDAQQPELVINDGQERRIGAVDQQSGRITFEHRAVRTGLYRLTDVSHAGDPDVAESGDGFHTLSVQLDAAPVLRILEPTRSTVELPRDGSPGFSSEVQVRDDYGVTSVEIRASVAKGSGEGVKFRDETFQFDSSMIEDDSVIYRLDWSLEQLGMEPGDEIYFFAVARDNRQPEANEARSDTVVVRWLDEAQPLEISDGLGISVLPEYYKSQRQIIIETEQLIADRDALGSDLFDATSRELAQAQAALKERYGQYLGDEFDEGDGASFTPPESSDSASEEEADEDGGSHAGHDHADDDHGATAGRVDTQGSAAELIERFAHNHGAAEIGPITRRNPVGLMKRSVSNMWQSELHLHLSEPEKALPFAYEALKYLDLARQADRIYTRRLGFEPPPVSEERRLTGELDDISSRVRRQVPEPDEDPQLLAEALFTHLGALKNDQPIPPSTRSLLRRGADYLTTLSQQRPALIRQAAHIERLLLADRINPVGCDSCLAELRQTAWALSGNAGAAPDRRSPNPATALQLQASAQYQEALQRLRAEQPRP